MNSSIKLSNFLFNTNYWKEYNETAKLKSVLTAFFNGEDTDLQKSFIKNFDYPEGMTSLPVRYEKDSGDIYYTLNFKSKEIFQNSKTIETAAANSLAALDKYLPLGVTQYLEPQPHIHIPDTFTLLCSLRVQTDITRTRTIWNGLGTIFKPLTILIILGTLIKYLIV